MTFSFQHFEFADASTPVRRAVARFFNIAGFGRITNELAQKQARGGDQALGRRVFAAAAFRSVLVTGHTLRGPKKSVTPMRKLPASETVDG
jgi:hypothetical protein